MSTSPKINDEFWFNMSTKMINESITRLKNGANKLQNLLLWAYGIYTGSAVFAIEFKDINEIGILIILSLPYLLLILGYWYVHVAQLPNTVEFDYRSPTLIEKAYIDAYNKSNRGLTISKWFTFIGLFTLAICLMLAFIIKNQPQDEEYLNLEMNTSSDKALVTGNFPKNSELRIEMISYLSSDSIRIHSDTFLNSESGVFFKNYNIDTGLYKVSYEVGWSDENYSYKLLKKLAIPRKQ